MGGDAEPGCMPGDHEICSPEQWAGHIAGKKHRKNTSVAKQRRFSAEQQYWAREAARFHLQMLYARYLVLLQHAAG
eukprot:1112527-Lingulodinium_polyedra.AAC.1